MFARLIVLSVLCTAYEINRAVTDTIFITPSLTSTPSNQFPYVPYCKTHLYCDTVTNQGNPTFAIRSIVDSLIDDDDYVVFATPACLSRRFWMYNKKAPTKVPVAYTFNAIRKIRLLVSTAIVGLPEYPVYNNLFASSFETGTLTATNYAFTQDETYNVSGNVTLFYADNLFTLQTQELLLVVSSVVSPFTPSFSKLSFKFTSLPSPIVPTASATPVSVAMNEAPTLFYLYTDQVIPRSIEFAAPSTIALTVVVGTNEQFSGFYCYTIESVVNPSSSTLQITSASSGVSLSLTLVRGS